MSTSKNYFQVVCLQRNKSFACLFVWRGACLISRVFVVVVCLLVLFCFVVVVIVCLFSFFLFQKWNWLGELGQRFFTGFQARSLL